MYPSALKMHNSQLNSCPELCHRHEAFVFEYPATPDPALFARQLLSSGSYLNFSKAFAEPFIAGTAFQIEIEQNHAISPP